MSDDAIIALFLQRDEQAICEVKRAYGKFCFSIAKNILGDDEDAEEVVSDAMLRVWNSIPPNEPDSLKQYLARIVRNLAYSVWREKNADKRGAGTTTVALEELSDCIPSRHNVEDVVNAGQLQRSINQFLGKLPQRECNVFVRRYFYIEEIPQIAQRYGLSEANVFQILSRTRRKLKNQLNKEGYFL